MLNGSSLLIVGDFNSESAKTIFECIKDRELRDHNLRLKKICYLRKIESELFPFHHYHTIIASLKIFRKFQNNLSILARTRNIIIISQGDWQINNPVFYADGQVKFLHIDESLQSLVNPLVMPPAKA